MSNEHVAIIYGPDKFSKFRKECNAFDEGIGATWGEGDDGKTQAQMVHFDTMKWSPKEAKQWLKIHFYKPIEFSEGEKPEAIFKVCEPGTYNASTGKLTITASDIDDAIEAFTEAKLKGVLPALKYTHASGTKAIGAGKITDMWKASDGWLMAKAVILDTAVRDGLKKGILTDISLEGGSSFPYSNKDYGLVISALSILAPGEFPAVPGASLTEIAAGASVERVVVMINQPEDTIAAEAPVVEAPVEAAVEDAPDEAPVEAPEDEPTEPTVEDRMEALEARIALLEESMLAVEDETPEEVIEPEPEAVAEGPTNEAIEASITEVEKKLQAGKRKSFREHINGLADNSAKQIVLAAASMFTVVAEPEVLLSGEQGDSEEAAVIEELPIVDRQEKAIHDVMARDHVDFVSATNSVVKENPELFS